MSNEDAFDEIAVGLDMADTVVVAFTQRPDCGVPEIDLTGTDDFDTAISIVTKGFFVLMLDALGFWDPDDEEDDDDAEEA